MDAFHTCRDGTLLRRPDKLWTFHTQLISAKLKETRDDRSSHIDHQRYEVVQVRSAALTSIAGRLGIAPLNHRSAPRVMPAAQMSVLKAPHDSIIAQFACQEIPGDFPHRAT
jgi:hypothetical protein